MIKIIDEDVGYRDAYYPDDEYAPIEYRSAIVDELGQVLFWCDELTEKQIEMVLTDHPDVRIAQVEV